MGTFLKRAEFGVFGVTLPPKQWQRYLPDEPYQKICPQYSEGGGWEKVWFKKESTTN